MKKSLSVIQRGIQTENGIVAAVFSSDSYWKKGLKNL